MNVESSVIMLEFNELTPSLMDRFIQDGKLPNFQRLYSEAEVYTTDAEAEPPYLNPWIQWVTVHSGLPYAEHGVFHLNEGPKLQQKCVWDLLSNAAFRVWVCGSMNVRFDNPLNGAVLPDPWTTAVKPYPDELKPYYRFIQYHVQEHTNPHAALRNIEYLDFLRFMLTHGQSAATTHAIVQQLLRERRAQESWKRAVVLDKLQWDVFRWYYRKHRPNFSTFFLNSTAHFQHKYWRNMEPEHFTVQPSAMEQAQYETAVLFGYQEMDRLVGKCLQLAGDKTTIIFCSALSQQPCAMYESEGGKCFYRPRNCEALLAFAGVTSPHTYSPVMSEQFHLYFEDEGHAREAEQRLRDLRVAGRPAVLVERKGSSVFSGCAIFSQLPQDAVLKIVDSKQTSPFFDIFYQADSLKSGMHHPDGILWIRTPDRAHAVHDEKVSLCDIAPTVLALFDVPQPEYMGGMSLVSGRDV